MTRLSLFLVLASLAASALAKPPSQPGVFYTEIRKKGDAGVHTYRIPGLATSKKGTLLAVFDLRHKHGGDLPADIDVGLMRSVDNGDNWLPMQRIMDFDASVPGSMGNGVGDPAILVDQKTGEIFVVALQSRGNVSWHGSGPGLKDTETGQLILVKSSDDGVTWSTPISLTSQVKNPAWHLCFQGPGAGFSLADGTLVFPAQFKDEAKVPHSCFIVSTDHGLNWKISPAAIPGKKPTSESAIAPFKDGSFLLSMRDESRSGQRLWATWDYEGEVMKGKWSQPWLALPDPVCMASLIRHPSGSLVFTNPASDKKRHRLSVRTSSDGKSWTEPKLIDPRPASYSCLTVLQDGQIGVLYEAGNVGSAEDLVFARFPLEWAMK